MKMELERLRSKLADDRQLARIRCCSSGAINIAGIRRQPHADFSSSVTISGRK